MKKIYLLVLIMLTGLFASAWFKIEGQYATVEYTKGNEVIADSLLKIAELDIPRLCKMAVLPIKSFRKHKARILLTDAPDLSNGFAIDDAIVIYALSSMYLPFWTGTDSWYKMVLSHELVHQTVFRKTRRKLAFFGFIFDLSVPRWFHEGIAQYFSEAWTAFRGDIYLQEALLGGRLTFDNMESLKDGRLLYSAGHAFVRYLATTYGDSSLVKLMAFNAKGFYYDFDKAFKAVYKKEPRELFPEFIRHMVIHYGNRLAAYPVAGNFRDLPQTGYTTYQMLPLNTKDSIYATVLKLDNTHLFNSLVILQFKKGKPKILKTVTTQINTPLLISADRRLLSYGRYEIGQDKNQLSLRYRWFVYDLPTEEESLIAGNIRARHGTFDAQNNLILAEVSPGGTIFRQFNQKGALPKTILKTEMPTGYLSFTPDGRMVFDAQRPDGKRDLFILDRGKIKALTNDAEDDRQALALNDSLLVFNRIDDRNFTLALYNLRRHTLRIKINAQRAYRLQAYDAQSKRVICSTWKAGRKNRFVYLPLDSLLKSDLKPQQSCIKKTSAAWQTKLPTPVNLRRLPDSTLQISRRSRKYFSQFPMSNVLSFVLPTYDYKEGWGLYGTSMWLEALQRQILQLTFVGFDGNYDKSLLLLGHLIKLRNFQVSNSFYHGPAIFSYRNKRYLQVAEDIYAFDLRRAFYLRGNSRFLLVPQIGFEYAAYRFLQKEAGYPQNSAFQGLRLALQFKSSLPTNFRPAISKRLVEASAAYFHSFSQRYNFNIRQAHLKLAKSIYLEEFGLSAEASWIEADGNMPALKRLGIDRFYQLNIPRDILETKTIRGVSEDISGDRLLWASFNATYLLQKSTSWKLLFLPMNNVAISAFYDFARVRRQNEVDVSGYGAELGFGDSLLRWSVGYAAGKGIRQKEKRQIYGRISLYLPQ